MNIQLKLYHRVFRQVFGKNLSISQRSTPLRPVALAENLLQQLGNPRSRIDSDFLLLPAYHEEESVKGPVGYVLIKVVFFLLDQRY